MQGPRTTNVIFTARQHLKNAYRTFALVNLTNGFK